MSSSKNEQVFKHVVLVTKVSEDTPIIFNGKQLTVAHKGWYLCRSTQVFSGYNWIETKLSLQENFSVLFNISETSFFCETKIKFTEKSKNYLITRKELPLVEGKAGDIICSYSSRTFFIARKMILKGTAKASIYEIIPICVNPLEKDFFNILG